jgi:hypothetical protein
MNKESEYWIEENLKWKQLNIKSSDFKSLKFKIK